MRQNKKLTPVPNQMGAFHLERESNHFVIDLTTAGKICWWWNHSGKNQTWRKVPVQGEQGTFFLQNRMQASSYLRLQSVSNAGEFMQLVVSINQVLASKFHLDSEYLSYGTKTADQRSLHCVLQKRTIIMEMTLKILRIY